MYISHWPNCNWCSKGTNHLANPGGDSGADDSDTPPTSTPDNSNQPTDGGEAGDEDPYSDVVINELFDAMSINSTVGSTAENSTSLYTGRMRKARRSDTNSNAKDNQEKLSEKLLMEAVERFDVAPAAHVPTPPAHQIQELADKDSLPFHTVVGFPPVSTDSLASRLTQTKSAHTADQTFTSTLVAQAPAKTNNGKAACTPSPTSSLAPTASAFL